MANPNFRRWEAAHSAVRQNHVPPGQEMVPIVGVGHYICDGCGNPHIIFSTVDSDGVEVAATVTPEEGEQMAMEILTRVAQLRGLAS